ncbi:MAG: glucosamine-6-phosphate deaminase [Actinomycetaceae bacterium]|nr:glucosamine-6-phosphate deaminase [Actinomycetaceae bacterium]
MQVGIFQSIDELAEEAASYIIRLVERKPDANIGVPTSSSPEGLYEKLRQAHKETDFTLEEARVFSLDEYVGLDADHPQLYHNVLRKNLVGPENTGLVESHLYTPKGDSHDLQRAADDFEKTIKSVKGIDLQILGIGTNGRVAFNEPGGSLASRCHIDHLTPQTKSDNARFFGGENEVPDKCITMGLATIMDAEHIVLMAFGQHKAEAVQHLVEGPISAMWPGTVLQMHRKTTILLDESAASRLVYNEHYREMWEQRHSEAIF